MRTTNNDISSVVLTVHAASGGTREYDAEALDADTLTVAFLTDYFPTFDNHDVARRMMAGEKPLKTAGDEWAASGAWTAHLKQSDAG